MANNEFSFSESQYRFTDPIRYFTSTDPYYWEVDNIPLKQLQENDQWLKDQIEEGFKNFRVSVERQDILELKPFTDTEDNVVKVKPGRFTARINDGYSSDRLQIIERVAGKVFNEPNVWRFATYDDPDLAVIIDKINSNDGDDALFLNGLMERNFTWHMRGPYEPYPDMNSDSTLGNLMGPVLKLYQWPGAGAFNSAGISGQWAQDHPTNRGFGMRGAAAIETILTKYWRGVFRLSIVDIPEDLSIEVPAFNQRDFDYYDENNNLIQNNDASVRIDLLFIYSKPIDASSTRVKSTRLETYKFLSAPELGLVRGAGVLLNKALPNSGHISNTLATFDDNDNLSILASPADAESTRGGFDGLNVRGSFPSPDDLLNIAPLIIDELETNDTRLVGQSVLPVAYIVVKKNAETNQYGEVILTNDDIIDIRPFLRTAELTYNERAGIAAATPQLSIANPVITDSKLNRTIIEVVEDYDTKLRELEDRINQRLPGNIAKVVAGGVICGGYKFGVEGAMIHHLQGLNRSYAESNDYIRANYNYPANRNIPFLPDWDADTSLWSDSVKEYPNDCVFLMLHNNQTVYGSNNGAFTVAGNPLADGRVFAGASVGDFAQTKRLLDLARSRKTLVYYVKKKIYFDKSAVPWLDNYSVHAELMGCFPNADGQRDSQDEFLGANSIWVDYRKDHFTIYCAFLGAQNININGYMSGGGGSSGWQGALGYIFGGAFGGFLGGLFGGGGGGPSLQASTDPFLDIYQNGLLNFRDVPELTAGFNVATDHLLGRYRSTDNVSNGGAAIYPTIKFSVIGYPRGSTPTTLGSNDPVISFV